MSSNLWVEQFAYRARHPNVETATAMQLTAASVNAETRSAACRNPYLTDTAWKQLFSSKTLSAKNATSLLERELTGSQREIAVNKETRSGPLNSLLASNVLTDTEAEMLLLRKKLTPSSAETLYLQAVERNTNPGLIRELALAAGKNVKLHWLASFDVSPASTVSFLSDLNLWCTDRSYRTISTLLNQITERVPSSLNELVKHTEPSAARLVAAMSRFITEDQARVLIDIEGKVFTEADAYMLAALVANPFTPRVVLEELNERIKKIGLTDISMVTNTLSSRLGTAFKEEDISSYREVSGEVLGWVYRRAMPWQGKSGKIFDLKEIALNPNLTEDERTSAFRVLTSYSSAEGLGKTAFSAFWDEAKRLYPDEVKAVSEPATVKTTALIASTSSGVRSDRYFEQRSMALQPFSQELFNPDTFSMKDNKGSERWREDEPSAHWSTVLLTAGNAFGSDRLLWSTFFTLGENYPGSLSDLVKATLQLR